PDAAGTRRQAGRGAGTCIDLGARSPNPGGGGVTAVIAAGTASTTAGVAAPITADVQRHPDEAGGPPSSNSPPTAVARVSVNRSRQRLVQCRAIQGQSRAECRTGR